MVESVDDIRARLKRSNVQADKDSARSVFENGPIGIRRHDDREFCRRIIEDNFGPRPSLLRVLGNFVTNFFRRKVDR